MSRKVKTSKVNDVRKESQAIGDSLATMYHAKKDIKLAMGALSGYKTAISAMKAQLIYKKLTGGPEKMDFFEE